MAPTREVRVNRVLAAGAACFGRLGYKRTRVSDVAAEAEVSAGSIYTYVESKEALFHLVLAALLGEEVPGPETMPVAAPTMEETIAMVDRAFRRLALTPRLRAALDGQGETSTPRRFARELAAIVDEQYAMVERLGPALTVIEACAGDVPALDEFYFGRRRRNQIGLLQRYLEQMAKAGVVRPVPDLAAAAQAVHEVVAWFAWKRHRGHDAGRFDDELARRTVVDMCCAALVAGRSGR